MTDSKHDEVQKKHELEQHEVTQVLDFLKRYGKLIIAGVIAATIAVLVARGFTARKAAKAAEAERMLMTAQSPRQLEELVNDYPSTPTAPVALLDLAKQLFNEGEPNQAREQYTRFINDYNRNDLLPVAEFGLAHCTEADGNFDAAISEWKTFLADHPGHYLESPAILALARCMEQAGQTENARITLEDFLAENEGSEWFTSAEISLQQLSQ